MNGDRQSKGLVVARRLGRIVDERARESAAVTPKLEHCRELLQLPPEQLDPPPLLTGDDLIRHGVPRGKEYKTLLDAVRDAQLNGVIRTKDEALKLVDVLRGKA